jgi:hypothetical protein
LEIAERKVFELLSEILSYIGKFIVDGNNIPLFTYIYSI